MARNFDVQPAEILLVEDNLGDARLTVEALKDGKVRNSLHHVLDGESALRFLLQEGEHADAPRPDLVLLDLNLPGKDGREILAEIKSHERLCSIPVVVLTSSKAERDVARSYALQANCYITKPVDFDKLVDVVREVEGFWFSVVTLSE